jgi:hypothetical protein
MTTEIRKTLLTHIICSVLVVFFLMAVPILSSAQSVQTAGEAVAAPAGEITPDPLHRVPSSPEEAHKRLEEKLLGWPEDATDDGSFSVAVMQPGVRVSIPFDTVEGFTNHPGGAVEVKLIRGGIIQTVNTTAKDDGWFKADLSAGNILSGDTVRVIDKADAAQVDVNCTLTATIDFNNNKVTGATAGNMVDAYIVAPSTYYADVPPGASRKQVAAAGGAYEANFSGLMNLKRGDAAIVYSTDAGGNKVMNVAANSGGGLVVYPQYDDVMGFYQPNTPLTVQAGTAARNVNTQGDGFFEAWFTNHNIVPGDTVSCNMGGARSITVQDVSAVADPAVNRVMGTAPANRELRITMNVYGTPVIMDTVTNASGGFDVSFAGSYTISGTEVFNVTWYNENGDCVVYQFQSFSWYLAEGYTGGQFDTWVLVQNPGVEVAKVTMIFQLLSGEAGHFSFDLPGGQRKSVHLDDLPGLSDAQVSTMVTSTGGQWIVAERAMYFTYEGKSGGHDSIGALTPSKEWYLAEGYTGGQFDTWVLVQNPGTQAASVTLTFQLLGGAAPQYSFDLPAGRRQSVHLDTLPGLADAQVSTKVDSTVPVVAERAEYFIYTGKPGRVQGGHDSIGVTAPRTDWYLAEGYTGGLFDTWVLVQNPSAQPAVVTFSFQLVSGSAPDFTFAVNSGQRASFRLNDLPGLSNAQVSTKVTSTAPVVAERAEYFNYEGKSNGHCSIGTDKPSSIWYLAEGYTGGQFDTWVLVQNPQAQTATVTLSFQLVSGVAPSYTFALEGGKRLSVHLDDLPGLSNAEVSTKVTSVDGYGNPVPVVAERAMYFIYTAPAGAHDSTGVPEVLQ